MAQDNLQDDLSPWDYFHIVITAALLGADVSDFADGEIRVISINLPFKDISKWDRKMPVVEPRHCDCGMDKERKLYWYRRDEGWIKQSK